MKRVTVTLVRHGQTIYNMQKKIQGSSDIELSEIGTQQAKNYNIASLDRSHIDFDSINYWRGPMWINLSWLILSEIKNLDKDLFNNIKDNCLDKINDIGFFEYFDSNDTDNLKESGIGDDSFSWTAAIFVCMLNDIEF